MTAPVRISHLPRRDGKLPEGAKYVGRPSRWGNPFKAGQPGKELMPIGRSEDGRLWIGLRKVTTPQEAVAAYWVRMTHRFETNPDRYRRPLEGATALACACPLGQPCHVSVLIELLGGTT